MSPGPAGLRQWMSAHGAKLAKVMSLERAKGTSDVGVLAVEDQRPDYKGEFGFCSGPRNEILQIDDVRDLIALYNVAAAKLIPPSKSTALVLIASTDDLRVVHFEAIVYTSKGGVA